ncbi:MAG: glycosyltransferase family 4 protein, partial [Planctomycetota bacterium]|nr:glycosyltransferase family 4 protein [Planctomycetota bacterium]
MTLLVVGEGTARASAEAYSDSLGLGDSVRFLGAIYDEEELAGWCLSSICMTYPVAVGLSVMHAFGYGLPVLTSDDLASHNPEINAIRDGVNGMLYREGEVRSLADAIIRLAGDPELRRRMSLAALDSVRGPDGWTVENMVDGFVRCIEAVRSMHQRG